MASPCDRPGDVMMIAANQPPEEPSPMKTQGPIPAGSVKEEPRKSPPKEERAFATTRAV